MIRVKKEIAEKFSKYITELILPTQTVSLTIELMNIIIENYLHHYELATLFVGKVEELLDLRDRNIDMVVLEKVKIFFISNKKNDGNKQRLKDKIYSFIGERVDLFVKVKLRAIEVLLTNNFEFEESNLDLLTQLVLENEFHSP